MKNSAQNHLAPLHTFIETPYRTLAEERIAMSAEDNVVAMFREIYAQVPAYREYLAKHGVTAADVHTYADFHKLPLVNKPDYLQAYPLPTLCREGDLSSCDLISVSSGSTGLPMFWPRNMKHELDIALFFEQIYRGSFQADKKRTLVIVVFPMGTWVGGLYSQQSLRYLSEKGYEITAVTPGTNKEEALRVVAELGPLFDQTVLMGYPPFVKDVIDTGVARGIEWQKYNVKMIFAGEVFTEEWRNNMCHNVGASNPCFDTVSLYGTADAAVLGLETPLSISIRRFLSNNPAAALELFGEPRLPSFVQYDPTSRFFEIHDGTLVLTVDNGIPLMRYHINDTGGIFSYEEMMAFCEKHCFDPLVNLGIDPHSEEEKAICKQPFVYVFGRADFTISFFGANIYPENVIVGLEQPEFQKQVSGKFVMEVRSRPNHDEYVHVVVELLPNMGAEVEADPDLIDKLAQSIKHHVRRLNSEFANYAPESFQLPEVELRPFGDTEYFPVGVKHRYTKK